MDAKDLESLLTVYKEVVEKVDLGIHVINVNEKTIIYNKKMREIEGMDIKDVLDKNLLDVFQFGPAESTLLQVLNTGEHIQNVKQTYFNNKGQEITTINHTFPIYRNGQLIGAMEIANDVTKLEKMIQENMYKKSDTRYTFDLILGKNEQLLEAIEISKRATRTTSSVLITGEGGTGKELFAHSIHNGSNRSTKPFLSQNCAALPDALLEMLFFGTEEEETDSLPGIFEQANGGTVLLDEVDSLSPALQTKLLKVIQEKKVRRIGGSEDNDIDVRILATINEDPIDAISAGKLRKDLYYRLSVISIFIPPLRKRKEDIEELVASFIEKYNHLFGMNVEGMDEEVRASFQKYDWPGNISELDHVIEGSMNLMGHDEAILMYKHLPIQFRQKSENGRHYALGENIEEFLYQPGKPILPLEDFMYEAETYYIKKALQHHGFNITKTAKALGMSRQNLQYRMRKYNIDKNE